jgi:hypothetical protein
MTRVYHVARRTISLPKAHDAALLELSEAHAGKVSRAIAWLLETHPETRHKVREEVAPKDNA